MKVTIEKQIRRIDLEIEDAKCIAKMLENNEDPQIGMVEIRELVAIRETLKSLLQRRRLPVLCGSVSERDRVHEVLETTEKTAILMYGGLSAIASQNPSADSADCMQRIALMTIANVNRMAAALLPKNGSQNVQPV
jgi:hypothetical protein